MSTFRETIHLNKYPISTNNAMLTISRCGTSRLLAPNLNPLQIIYVMPFTINLVVCIHVVQTHCTCACELMSKAIPTHAHHVGVIN